MALSLYEGGKRRTNWPLFMVAVNVCYALSCIFGWSVMSGFLSDPMHWATTFNVGSSDDFLRYPFSLIWGLPTGAAVLAWLAHRCGGDRLAFAFGVFPPLLFSMIITWYHLTPLEWH